MTPPRHRPPWWPEDEPFPPDAWGRAGPRWRADRRRRPVARRLGCFFALMWLAMVASVVLVLWLLAALFGSVTDHRIEGAAALVILGVVVIGLSTGVRFGRRFVGPLGELVDASRRIEAGDLSARVPELQRGPRDLRALTAAFNTMAARLEAEEANRRRLLADLSHELRTPIAVIEGHLEAILDGVYPPDAAHLDPILDETRVLDRLIDDLRTLSLAEAGALALHREATDLGHVVADVVAAHRQRAEAAGTALQAEVDPGLPELDIDPVRIHQVISNLLDNAVRYTPAGGRIQVTARRLPGSIEVAVADQGPGLAPEVRATLFDRFVKAKDSPGSGLGLAIARAIVEAHGGRIRADPGRDGTGTTVAFSLPIGAPPAS